MDCPKKQTCTELCYDMRQELEKVTGGRCERFISPKDDLEQDAFYRDYNNAFKGDDLKKVIIELFHSGKTEREIAYYHGVGCNHQYVHKVISAYKKSSAYQARMRKRKYDSNLRKKRSVTNTLNRDRLFFGGFFEKHR